MLVRAAKLTCACSSTTSPRWMGERKSRRSIDAVTTGPRACFKAATPAHTSIHCITTPPNITVPERFVCIGITICVITTRDSVGERAMPPRYSILRERAPGRRLAGMRKTWLAIPLLMVSGCGYNSLVSADEEVKAAWAQVENVYQRRADLI